MEIVLIIASIWTVSGLAGWLWVPAESENSWQHEWLLWMPFFVLLGPLFWLMIAVDRLEVRNRLRR